MKNVYIKSEDSIKLLKIIDDKIEHEEIISPVLTLKYLTFNYSTLFFRKPSFVLIKICDVQVPFDIFTLIISYLKVKELVILSILNKNYNVKIEPELMMCSPLEKNSVLNQILV